MSAYAASYNELNRMSDQLLPLPLTERSVHLCVDMQRLFTADGPCLRRGWTGSCQSSPPSRTVTLRELSSLASFRQSDRIKCRACGDATTRVGGSRLARSFL
jgi:hypothetical protein